MPPVSRIPAATTYIMATVIRPSLAKPARASAGLSTPAVSKTITPPNRINSGAMRLNISKTTLDNTTPMENQAGKPIFDLPFLSP
jgi:hypothetical protein